MFAAAVSRERLSLRDLAVKLKSTYQEMRQVWKGTSAPSPSLLAEICRFLHIDFDKAEQAVNADRLEHRFGRRPITIQSLGVRMEPYGRFGQMLEAAVSRERLSLRDLAAKIEYTYEQLRKVWIGTSSPSPLLLSEICRFLHIGFDSAQKAVNADRTERNLGRTALNMRDRDPRLADIEELLPELSDQEWGMFVAQMRGFAHQKRIS